MQDEDKTKEQLMIELHALREQVAEFGKDKAERKRAEEALRESQQMLHSVLDNIPARVFWKDLNSNFLGCNRPFALDGGLQSPEEIIGKNDFEMGWAEQAELYRSDDRLVMETGQPKLGYEEPQTKPDGSRIWLRTNKVPLRDTEGGIKGILGTYEDITKNKQMEDMLRTSETRYRIVADNTYDWEYFLSRFSRSSPERTGTLREPAWDFRFARSCLTFLVVKSWSKASGGREVLSGSPFRLGGLRHEDTLHRG